MSADNWRVCPRCQANKNRNLAEEMNKVAASYGKVPPSEYVESMKRFGAEQPIELTLREEYELGMTENGTVYISYACACECGFGFSFKHAEVVPLTATFK